MTFLTWVNSLCRLVCFERRLPAEQKNMVLSTMKDPYMFDFIDYTEEMLETDIENELVKNVTSLLMELGTGFAFMGQQYHLEVGGKDFYIDLLFYNTKLRCYVAIDLKTGEFKPEQAGKMNFYLSALDDLVKAPEDNPSVGLILCRDENRTIAEYALRDMSKPIGVSEYHLCTDLPLDLKNALPAVEDIRSRIDMKKVICADRLHKLQDKSSLNKKAFMAVDDKYTLVQIAKSEN